MNSKYILLIYNPVAGNRDFPTLIDYFLEVFQNIGYDILIHRTMKNQRLSDYLKDKPLDECDAIFVAGGDGSVNAVVNHLMTYDLDIPIGILPAGTSNDFATYLGISDNLSEAIEDISKMQWKYVDIGKANDRYFINVCSGGFFTNVAHNVNPELKNVFGKLAYYVKGVRQVPKFRPLNFQIHTNGKVYDEPLYLFLLMNTHVTGGFGRLAVNARTNDGKMDFIGIKETPMNYVPTLFAKILQGEHLDDPYIMFIQSDRFKIECLSDLGEFDKSDLDGEMGPSFPLEIEIIKKRIRVLY